MGQDRGRGGKTRHGRIWLAAVPLCAIVTGVASLQAGGAVSRPRSKTPTAKQYLALQGKYHGPERHVPNAYPAPRKKRGTHFVVGWLNPNGQVPGLNTEQRFAQKETKALGGKFIALDANASITTQVSQFNDLLAEHVSAILVNPNSLNALTPELKKAKAQHVPVISVSGAIAGQKPWKGYATNIAQGEDQAAYYNDAAVALAHPHAKFAVISYAAPIPVLEYWARRVKYWGKKLGLRYVGEVDTLSTTPSGSATAMSAILAKYPHVQAVFCFNDGTAESAAATARTAGKKNLLVSGTEGDPAARALNKNGEKFSTFQYNWDRLGSQGVIAAYDLVTHQHLPLARMTAEIGQLITKANVNADLNR